jgi:hypothetical protein
VNKNASRKTKPPLEKLSYEKSEEESKAVVAKHAIAFFEDVARNCELKRKLPKPMFLCMNKGKGSPVKYPVSTS